MNGAKVGVGGALLLLWLLMAGSGFGQESVSGFTHQLTPEEFAAAGLEKLSAAERAVLDRLIARTRPDISNRAPTPPPRESVDTASVPENARVRRATAAVPAPRTISSRLVGRFTGWTGGTIFQLENGQRWVQVEGDSYRAHPPKENPAVEVRPAMMGTYFLKVDGYGTRCRVKLLDD